MIFYLKQILFLALISLTSTALCATDHGIVSMYAVDCKSGEVQLDKNSDLSLVPASCMKIMTTAAALKILGEDSRFETHLEYDGSIDEGTLQGNIYIKGGGDPCLGSDRFQGNPSWQQQIGLWADSIQKLGIQKVAGTVLGDVSLWEKANAVPSWALEDVGNYYGAPATALSFHENYYTLYFKPGKKVGDAAHIVRTEPEVDFLLHNEVTTGPVGSGDSACIYGSEFSSEQFVRGSIPLGVDEFCIKGALPDPAAFAARLLAKELKKRGIPIEEKEAAAKARISIHTTYSPTTAEIVYFTNQKSINLFAEHLLKKMGEIKYKDGSTDSGTKAVAHFWKTEGIDLEGFHIVDGSGLSRKNLVTSKQLVEILSKIKSFDSYPQFFKSLPQKGSARAKSGTMSHIKGYAGYVGHKAFALLINNCTNPQKINEEIEAFFKNLEEGKFE